MRRVRQQLPVGTGLLPRPVCGNQLDGHRDRPTAVTDLATDGQYVYWSDTTDQTINRIAVTGGTILVLAQSQYNPVRIAVDDTYVYWSNQLGEVCMRTVKDGTGTSEMAAAASSPYGVVLDAQNVYWVNQGDGTVRAAPKGVNSTSVVLADLLPGDSGTALTGQQELITDGTALFVAGVCCICNMAGVSCA